jgi:large subunit ribosomal protein L21
MYAIVEISGKQYRVSKDMILRVPRLESDPGKKVGFDKVLFIEDDKGKTTFGNPLIKNMLVNATVVEHGRDKKVIIFKKKRRKGYQKTQGHRQGYSIIEINTIAAGTLKKESAPAKPKAAEAEKATTVKKETKPAAEKKTAASAKPRTTQKAATKVKTGEEKNAAPAKKSAKPAAKKAAAPKKTTAKKASTDKKPAAGEEKKEE